MSEFEGKVVVITGAGQGIGREHALEFARRGARVLVNDLGSNIDGSGHTRIADQVVEEIRAQGGTAAANYHSVADSKEASAIIEQAMSEFGTVDILINNAGILRNKTFKNTSIEDMERVIQVHLMGTLYVTHAAWPIMYEKNYGRIVFTSSISGVFGTFGQSAYGTAKMGMLGLMNVLALEGRNHNIHVNCLSPGADTRLTGLDPHIDVDNPRELMHPRLVAPAAVFLAGEAAPTGQVIHALGSVYFRSETVRNPGVKLGANATYEDLVDNTQKLQDLSEHSFGLGLDPFQE